MTTLNFSKLHATGNDFLVLVDLEARFGSRGRNRLAPSLRAALCDRRGARLTAIRRRVLELVWRSHQPVGAYEILGRLKRNGKRAAPPTVYRALDFLLENGLVHRLESLSAYIGCPHPEQRHTSQFLICRQCSGVAEIYDPGISTAVSTSAAAAGFVVSRLTIELQGLCPRCREDPALQ